MKKKGLNLLSIFLASLFIISAMVGMIPAAYASETETEDYESNETNYESEESASGSNEGGIFIDADLELEEITIENPDNNGESAEINANDQFSHYLPTEGAGGEYVIEDGVYALENVGNSGLWMDIESGKSTPGYHMQQQALTSNPAQTFTRRYLFKISRVPGTNRYVIRSMLNNMLTFYCSGNEVLTKEISPNDADVAIADSFQIEYVVYSGSFIIRPYATSSAIATGSSTDSGEFLIKSTSSASGDRGKWYMYKYTGAVKDGLTVTKNKSTIKGMPTGMTVTFTARIWCTVIGVNTPYIVVAPGYEDIVSSTWNNTNRSITVTSMKAGKLRFKIKLMYDNMQDEYRAYNYDYITVPDIDGKTMFIKNAATGKYMDIEGPSKAEGAIIQQWQFNDKPQSKWTFTAYDGGYFTIKSQYSNKYVGVDPTNVEYIRQYGTVGNNTLWKFIETTSGNYKLVCKSLEASGYVLATQSRTSGNGSNLTMTAYTDDTNYRDEWCPQQYVVFENMSMGLGQQSLPNMCNLVDTSGATASNFTYTIVASSPANVVSINSSNTIIANNRGVALIKSQSEAFGVYYFKVTVTNLLIYRTREREIMGFENPNSLSDITPIIPEDMQYGQKSLESIMLNVPTIQETDLQDVFGNPINLSARVNAMKTSASLYVGNDPIFTTILFEMVDHFVGGSGENYTNDNLTQSVKDHPNTQEYVNDSINVIKSAIVNADGNIYDLVYDEALWIQPVQRTNQVIVAALRENEILLPYYGLTNGVPGLTLAIDGWHGNKIEIETFTSNGVSYSGTIRFTFYDHFGLDTTDMSLLIPNDNLLGLIQGFTQWYILQHWDGLGASTQPKPFVTIVSFTVPFSGEY